LRDRQDKSKKPLLIHKQGLFSTGLYLASSLRESTKQLILQRSKLVESEDHRHTASHRQRRSPAQIRPSTLSADQYGAGAYITGGGGA
jgi:hypothetical protein